MKTPPCKKILIVEDEVIVSRDIRLQLEMLGYDVIGETRYGEEAVDLTLRLDPDLVLMDIQLGGEMNGIQAGRQIIEETDKPIVFLTAFASGDLFEQAKAISPAGYILKPFEERELRIILEMAVYKQKVEHELRLKSNALSAAANAVVITDKTGLIEWANRSFTLNSGYSAEEAFGKRPGELLKSGKHPPEFYQEMWETITRGEVWDGEITNKRKDGTLYQERMTITPIFAASGAITHYIAIKQDITQEKALETMYLRAQRLESIGTLAGGIAHDLNNILAPILMSGDLLLNETLTPDQRKMVELIHESAKRGADVVRQVLAFARGEDGNRTEIQLRHLIVERCNVSRQTFPKNIQVEEQVPRDLWPVQADPTQIHQVLMNLMINARDAMPKGGTLTVTACNRIIDKENRYLSNELKPGPCVELTISDTGTGIPPDIIERIFDPFFTTKAPGKGSGLGLSSAMGILRGHKGALRVNSTPGEGSTFKLFLPADARKNQSPVQPELPHLPAGNQEPVLVVDDEDSIRWMIRNTLQSLGYRVELARNGQEALEKIQDRKTDPYRLLLLDLMMPVMNGPELVSRLKPDFPELPVLIMSGMLPENGLEQYPGLSHLPFLQKPFSIETLANLVAEQLKSGPVPPPKG
ncbi:MAG: response regulator [Verrucomicrobia bacterium]|nr:response regulator [Verrucomicrobiota bacterium]MCH8528611.1 response regulator [Kiritimatiellia bacterium]